MSISKIGGNLGDTWELISSVTPTVSTAAVNFTGLSPYRRLLVRWEGIVLNASGGVGLRINNDTGSDYNYQSGANNYPAQSDQFIFYNAFGTNHRAYALLDNCNNAALVELTAGAGVGGSAMAAVSGYYRASAVVTQINVITDSTFTAVGNVSLYGVK